MYVWERPADPPPSGHSPIDVTALERARHGAPEVTTYGYGRGPAVWVWASEGLPSPQWQRAQVVAKHQHRDGPVYVQVELPLDGGGYTQAYRWGQDGLVPAAPPRSRPTRGRSSRSASPP